MCENSKYRILVVEDEPEMRSMLVDHLREREGFIAFEAENGQHALDTVLRNEKIDLVLSDINMPVMKGFELLKNVRVAYPTCKRVLITAYNVEDYLELAITHDIGNIFIKSNPFNFRELSIVLRNLLRDDIFGIEKHFAPGTPSCVRTVTNGNELDTIAHDIVSPIPSVVSPKKFELVLMEILTNAIFYGIRNEAPDKKESWDYSFNLEPSQAIEVRMMYDAEKYAVSILDAGGRLKKQDVLYWLHRQIAQAENGMPLGLFDNHGRGFFIARKFVDRVHINIKNDVRTEIILVNYFNPVYAQHKPLYINEL